MRKVKQYSSEEKVEALKRYFVNREEISVICEDLGIPPSTFYGWQQQFLNNAKSAFERDATEKNKAKEERIEYLENKLRNRDEAVSELMQEYIKLKKILD